MQKILFRADASSTIGTGHIMRDLVLAKQYPDSEIIFATQDLEGNLNHKITEAGYQVEVLSSNSMDELNRLIKKLHVHMLVLDHYEIDDTFEKQLKNQNSKLLILSFDDCYEKHHCDILFNHNISADKHKYKDLVPPNCELRCGSKYTLLREEFYTEKKLRREKVYDIFIAMGGADTANLNTKLLELLPSYFKIAVVTTTANKNLEALKAYVKDKAYIDLHINSTKIAQLMNQSNFAIVTPSVTVNEIYFMDLAFMAIKTANNQQDIYDYLYKNNHLVIDEFNTQEIIEKSMQKINFTQLSYDEKVKILAWRNHSSIRKWMFNKEPISLESHLSYIDTLANKTDRLYFVIKHYHKDIGVIDFTNIDLNESKAEIGLYSEPMLKGVGKLLMENIIAYGFNQLKLKKLTAEVYEDNLSAIKLYIKFNFKKVSIKASVITMELTNENR